jgi:PPK2 family polyphosphate:nucleotide phosphotransferase
MSKNSKIDPEKFRVRPGHKIKLKNWPTRVKPFYTSEADYQERLDRHRKEMESMQDLFYAHHRYALLLIFQAMDAGGKDSAIEHVMSGVNPQGCQVFSFKHPSTEELSHDFLWRTNCCLPERGHIGIFNRSYYEEVLVVRVHPEFLEGEGLPKEMQHDEDIWKHRYTSIADLEKHLYRNGTRVIKFFLHLSKEEQRKRFLRRIDDPAKNWKFSLDDIQERKFWKQYTSAYEACLGATSFDHAPWYAVPADDKKNARLVISQVIVDTLKSLKMGSPKASPGQRRELRAVRKALIKE